MWTPAVHFFRDEETTLQEVPLSEPVPPGHAPNDQDDEEDALARELVEEALAPMRPSLTAEAYELLRADLIIQLLTTPEGQAQLRRARPAQRVERSGDVVRGDAPTAGDLVDSSRSKVAGDKR